MMTKWLSFVIGLSLVVGLVGCGGPTAEVKGPGGKTLKVTAPSPTTIKQGETEKITVKVSREKFDDAVDLDFSDLPEGVTIVESERKIPKGQNEATFTLKADEKADPKEGHKAKVAGKAGDVKAGPLEFTVNVKPRS